MYGGHPQGLKRGDTGEASDKDLAKLRQCLAVLPDPVLYARKLDVDIRVALLECWLSKSAWYCLPRDLPLLRSLGLACLNGKYLNGFGAAVRRVLVEC